MTRRAYAKLTPREEQRIIALRAEGLTFDVIAVRVGCSKGTVWNTLHAHESATKCGGAIAAVGVLLKKTGRLP